MSAYENWLLANPGYSGAPKMDAPASGTTAPSPTAKGVSNPMFWNGSTWVDQYGAAVPQGAGDAGIWDNRNDRSQAWARSLAGVGQQLWDYYAGGDYAQQRADQQQLRGMAGGMVADLNGDMAGRRAGNAILGQGADAAYNAGAQANAMGMDPMAYMLAQRNAAGQASMNAYAQYMDPVSLMQRQAQAMQAIQQLQNLPWLNMLGMSSQIDATKTAEEQRNRQMDDASGGFFGSILGSGIGLLGAGTGGGGSILGGLLGMNKK